jgi:catechol 2,3-dioxygenase-like lactoylglutathione lyase family enzyme
MAKKKTSKSRKAVAKARPRKKRASGKVSGSFAPGSGAISITVDDLQQSLAWYTDVLGFRVAQRWEHQGVLMGVELTAGDVTTYLSQEDGKKGPRVKGQGVRIYWYTTQNIDRIAAGITSRGGTLAREPKDEWGVRSFDLLDPTGYLITVSSER